MFRLWWTPESGIQNSMLIRQCCTCIVMVGCILAILNGMETPFWPTNIVFGITDTRALFKKKKNVHVSEGDYVKCLPSSHCQWTIRSTGWQNFKLETDVVIIVNQTQQNVSLGVHLKQMMHETIIEWEIVPQGNLLNVLCRNPFKICNC